MSRGLLHGALVTVSSPVYIVNETEFITTLYGSLLNREIDALSINMFCFFFVHVIITISICFNFYYAFM